MRRLAASVTALFAISFAATSFGATPEARPRLIIFGGGWGPEGTQASIERHVVALRESLASRQPTTLFAGGSDRIRSVQESSASTDALAEWLGLIFDRGEYLGVRYRQSTIKGVASASRQRFVSSLLDAAKDARGLIVFGVGHGSPKTDEHQASLDLWGPDDKIYVDDLATVVADLPLKGPLALVLGQCHGGAFAALSGVKTRSGQQVCTLTAVTADRQASGCTPDVSDPSARAYMLLIANAFTQNRGDYDADGKVTLEEAHAYAQIENETVDVPVKSSELWMARTLGKDYWKKRKLPTTQWLLARARPSDKAIIVGLEEGAFAKAGPSSVRQRWDLLEAARRHAEDAVDAAFDERDVARRVLLDRVLVEFPELANPFHPEARRLMSEDASQLLAFIEGQPSAAPFRKRHSAYLAADAKVQKISRETARVERFLRAVGRVRGERQLMRRRAGRKLRRLLACEAIAP